MPQVRKATKCLFSMSKRPGDRLHCTRPNNRNAESRALEAPRERGPAFSGLTRLVQAGAHGSYSASPTANPVGRRRRSVCATTGRNSSWALLQGWHFRLSH